MLTDVDRPIYRTNWLCEKWSEEACDFARGKLAKRGIEYIPGPTEIIVPQGSIRERLAGHVLGKSVVQPVVRPKLVKVSEYVSSEVLRAIIGDPEEVVEIEGNLLVNEGIQRVLDLAIAAVNNQTAGNAFNNGSSFIGVGDSSTAEAATQTDLQAASNHFYKAMNATFPSRASQTVTWQSDFATGEANYVWNEWTISAGATTASGSGFTTGTTNLNRKVASLGTKASGTWTLSGQVTLS